ncbi:MAG: flavin reductase family protein [Ilumatobacteraceae bacterium]
MTAPIDPRHFRTVLGHLPTGVVVVAGLDASGAPHGLTIGSFVSISLDPPLVGFFPGAGSQTWPRLAARGAFCANVLTTDQTELCWRFAKEADDRFAGVGWRAAPSGSPVLDGALAWIDCTIESTSRVGDHEFVVGRVGALEAAAGAAGAAGAMTFYRGAVGGVAPQA